MAASTVYNLSSFISSHSFVNLYAVDYINYVKSGGKSLSEGMNLLDPEDFDSFNEMKQDPADESTKDIRYGLRARLIREKLSKDVGWGGENQHCTGYSRLYP